MKTSQKLNLTLSLSTLALLMSACGAKVEGGNIPDNLLPQIPNSALTTPSATPTPAPSSSGSASASANNPLFGKKFSSGQLSIGFDYVSAAQLNVVRTCGYSDYYCHTMGESKNESFSVKVNDASSIHSEDFGSGLNAMTSVTADDKKVTFTSNLITRTGTKVQTIIHEMTFSQTPCGSSNGAGLEDNYTQTVFIDDGFESSSSCIALY